MRADRHYNQFRHKFTGTRYLWVDLSTAHTGYVYVCTEAQSIYIVRYANIERIEQ